MIKRIAAVLSAVLMLSLQVQASDRGDELSSLGVFTAFEEKESVSRAEAAMAVASLASLSSEKTEGAFEDVTKDTPCAPYVYALYENGIVKGTTESTFEPEKDVKFIEAVAMLVRALGYEPAAELQGGYPTGYIKLAARLSITNKIPNGAYDPVSGENLVKLMYNALKAPRMKMTSYSEGIEGATYTSFDWLTFRSELEKVTLPGEKGEFDYSFEDGKAQYSPFAINVESSTSPIVINLAGTDDEIKTEVIDTTGKTVYEGAAAASQDGAKHVVSSGTIKEGTYYIKLFGSTRAKGTAAIYSE